MSSWIAKDAQHTQCVRHDHIFRTGLETCPDCDLDPEPLPDLGTEAEAQIDTPEGCLSTLDHERQFTQLAEEAHEIAVQASKAQDPQYSTIAKLLDTQIKAMRASAQMAKEREQRTYYKTLARSAESEDEN